MIISAARRMLDSFGLMIRRLRAANFRFRSFSSILALVAFTLGLLVRFDEPT